MEIFYMTNFLPPSYFLIQFKIYLKLIQAVLTIFRSIWTARHMYMPCLMVCDWVQGEASAKLPCCCFFVANIWTLRTVSSAWLAYFQVGIIESMHTAYFQGGQKPRAASRIFRLQKNVCAGQTSLPPIQKNNAICQVSQSQAWTRNQELHRP